MGLLLMSRGLGDEEVVGAEMCDWIVGRLYTLFTDVRLSCSWIFSIDARV